MDSGDTTASSTYSPLALPLLVLTLRWPADRVAALTGLSLDKLFSGLVRAMGAAVAAIDVFSLYTTGSAGIST